MMVRLSAMTGILVTGLVWALMAPAVAAQSAPVLPLFEIDAGDGAMMLNPALTEGDTVAGYTLVLGDRVYRFDEVRRDLAQPAGGLWVGRRTGGDPREEIVLTIGSGTVFGRVVTRDGGWQIGPEEAGGAVTIRRETRRVLDPEPGDTIAGRRAPPAVLAGAMADRPTVAGDDIIDVGILYSQELRDYYGPVLATRMQYLVNLYDQALRESGTGVTARLAYLGEVPTAWNDQVTTAQTLDDLYAGGGFGDPGTSESATGSCILSEPCVNDGDLSGVQAIRDARALDVIVFVRRAYRLVQQGCGIAFVNGQNAADIDPAQDGDRAFAVIGDGLDASGTGTECTELVMAHEIGHLMGSDHNIEAARQIGVFDYSYGYRNDCVFKTILSYDSLGSNVVCAGNNPAVAPNEVRVVRYSNPALADCLGLACGSTISDPVTDNARSIRMEGRDVQFFRHPSAPSVRSAVLPLARAVRIGEAATAFLSIANPAGSGETARDCGLVLHGAGDGQFSYQTTDPASNALTGTANTPVDIPAGAVQTYVFTLQSPTAWTGRDLIVSADCANRRMTAIQPGINTFNFISTGQPLADIVAVSVTPQIPGVLELPSADGAAAFAVATSNLGALSSLVVSARMGAEAETDAIARLEFCRTDPASGTCLSARQTSGTILFRDGEQSSFAVFVRGQGVLASRPAVNRVFLDFRTPGGLLVGSTSVAVRTAIP